MFELMDLGSVLPSIPGIGIRVSDLHIDVEPSDVFLLPTIHIDARLEIRFPWRGIKSYKFQHRLNFVPKLRVKSPKPVSKASVIKGGDFG